MNLTGIAKQNYLVADGVEVVPWSTGRVGVYHVQQKYLQQHNKCRSAHPLFLKRIIYLFLPS
jgi:hypothetical protein